MRLRITYLALLAIPVLAQSPLWGQCGGIGWTGSTTCVSGATCNKQNDWYWQCLPGSPTPPVQSTSMVTVTTPASPTSSTITASTSTTFTQPSSGTCSTIPANPSLTTNSKLPDPFTSFGGSHITTKSAWMCRRDEIIQLLQKYELGVMPPKPSSVTASFSSNTLTIRCAESGKSISFSVGMSIPTPAGVAIITFNNDDMAAQQDSSSRGQGKFYTLYGSGHSAGAMTAWAWGVSRIVDALEITAAARINTQRLAVTGCSRNGKGAMMAGAFEQRIALTIPQESGSGGSACWRLSDAQKSSGANVQTASEIVTENVWFSQNFVPYVNSVARLPFDHHMLAGMVAPRGLFVIENFNGVARELKYLWLHEDSPAWQALGVSDAMGYSQVGNHNHCQFPSSQQSDLNAFINKFLLGQSSNTAIMKTDETFTCSTRRSGLTGASRYFSKDI